MDSTLERYTPVARREIPLKIYHRGEDRLGRRITAAAPAPAAAPPRAAREPPPKAAAKPRRTGWRRALAALANGAFYGALVLVLLQALSFAGNTDTGKSLFGYRYYYVKTGSMAPERPIGSVVIVKLTDPAQIQVGDDITYHTNIVPEAGGAASAETYVTHRVIEVLPQEGEEGTVAFRTKGVANAVRDPYITPGEAVVGKVVLCIPLLGYVMTYVQQNLLLSVALMVLAMLLVYLVAGLVRGARQEQAQKRARLRQRQFETAARRGTVRQTNMG